MSNSAHRHRKAGTPSAPPKRLPSINSNLVCFLAARGLYQPGRHGIDFKYHKKRLDQQRAA